MAHGLKTTAGVLTSAAAVMASVLIRPPMRTGAALAVLLAAAALTGCGGGSSSSDGTTAGGGTTAGSTAASPATEAPNPPKPPRPRPPAAEDHVTLAPTHCPSGHPACRSTSGRIVYVERVDPDGDGDAHFVVIDPQGITLPGLTAIDVRVGLRPHPLPGIGDLVAASGPVQTGSYGQHQIHALTVHVGRSH